MNSYWWWIDRVNADSNRFKEMIFLFVLIPHYSFSNFFTLWRSNPTVLVLYALSWFNLSNETSAKFSEKIDTTVEVDAHCAHNAKKSSKLRRVCAKEFVLWHKKYLLFVTKLQWSLISHDTMRSLSSLSRIHCLKPVCSWLIFHHCNRRFSTFRKCKMSQGWT